MLGLGFGLNRLRRIGGFVGLLDLFPNAAAAYSLRKLRAAYSGSAVRVRRSSDNTEQDIGFTTQGELDTASLLSFVNEDVVVYTSDFTSGNEDLGEYQGIGTDGETIDGVSDAYKFTLSGGLDAHIAQKANFLTTNTYNVSFDYYIPSGQTVDGIQIRTNQTGDGFYNQNVLDAWTSVTISDWNILTGTNLRIYAIDGGSVSLDADGDVFYLKNIVVTQTTADGHVTTWYDQSLSNDATQTTAANQPKIVSAGSLVTENGKAAIQFDGVNDYLQASTYFANFLHESESSVFSVASVNSGTNNGSAIISTSNAGSYESIYIAYYLAVDNRFTFTNRGGVFVTNGLGGYPISNTIDSRYNDDQQYLISAISNPSDATALNRSLVYNDGSDLLQINSNTQAAASGNSHSQLKIFATLVSLKGVSQEIIIYPSDQSANRTGIETNINDFYTIYP